MKLVSVIIPCYNHDKYINDTLKSIRNQTYQNIEIIIVDDHSQDESLNIIKNNKKQDNRIKLICHSKNMGASKSRNDGINISQGHYISFCDADDIWMNEKVEKQIGHLNNNPNINIVYSDAEIINSEGKSTGKLFSELYAPITKNNGEIFYDLCKTNFINTQTVLLRKRSIENAGLFPEHIKYVEDWVYWTILAQNNLFGYMEIPLAKYRIHENNTNKDTKGLICERIKAYTYLIKNLNRAPDRLLANMYYSLGVELLLINERSQARNNFCKSIQLNRLSIKNYIRYFQSLRKN
jgi:glycosyltransferase involved in cell wall biosynthesis